MKDARLHLALLSALSISSVATYLAMFHTASSKTVQALTATVNPSAAQQLQEKQKELQGIQQKLQTAQSTLQSTTQNYQQAYSVIQRDDQVLQVLDQRLQSLGIQPVALPATPKPLKGIHVNSAPPPIQAVSGAS